MPPEDAACGRAVRAACRTVGFEPRVRWETDDMLLLARAVADGHGVAVLPRRSVALDAASGFADAPVEISPLRTPALTRRLLAVARAAASPGPSSVPCSTRWPTPCAGPVDSDATAQVAPRVAEHVRFAGLSQGFRRTHRRVASDLAATPLDERERHACNFHSVIPTRQQTLHPRRSS